MLVSSTFSNKKKIQDPLEKWLVLGLMQEIYKMNLEHPVVPENESVLETKNKNQNPNYGGYVQRTQEPIERAPKGQSWNNWSNQINKVVLEYSPSLKNKYS